MTTHSSRIGSARRVSRPRASVRNLFGYEELTYTQETSVAVGIAGAFRIPGPSAQGTGKRGGTDV